MLDVVDGEATPFELIALVVTHIASDATEGTEKIRAICEKHGGTQKEPSSEGNEHIVELEFQDDDKADAAATELEEAGFKVQAGCVRSVIQWDEGILSLEDWRDERHPERVQARFDAARARFQARLDALPDEDRKALFEGLRGEASAPADTAGE